MFSRVHLTSSSCRSIILLPGIQCDLYIFFQEVSEHVPSIHVLAPRSIEVKLEIQGSRWGSAYDYRERCGGEVKSRIIHWAIRALSSDISFHVHYFPLTVYARAMRQCGCQGLNPSPASTTDLKGLHVQSSIFPSELNFVPVLNLSCNVLSFLSRGVYLFRLARLSPRIALMNATSLMEFRISIVHLSFIRVNSDIALIESHQTFPY